jgi:subtilisin family serine protease
MKNIKVLQLLLAILALFTISTTALAQNGKARPAHRAAGSSFDIEDGEYKKGEVLVKFRDGVGPDMVSRIKGRSGLKTLRRYSRFGVHRLGIERAGMSVEEAVKALRKSPEVLYAEPNYRLTAAALPDDTSFSALWGLDNTGQTGGTADADIDAPEAWDITTGSPGIVIGVIDSGVDYTHPDLAANMWVNPGETPDDEIDNDGNGYTNDIHGIDAANGDADPMDDYGHGTHCAGTIGAVGDNGLGVVGVSWNVKIMALKFLDASGSGWTADAVECLNYAVMMKTTYGVNLKLTSNSWGGGGFSQSLKDAVEATADADMLFVVAAGNDGLNNDTAPNYPSNYDLPNIISVAATDHNDALAGFSNYGAESVDLGAPGVDILSTLPGGSYGLNSGTSMATPHVSGAAALLLAAQPTLTNLQAKEILLANTDPIPALTGKVWTGGRLNVFEALTCDSGGISFDVSLENGFQVELGMPVTLSARLSECGFLRGATVAAEFSNGDTTIWLTDDGAAPDVAADDGVYTGSWSPGALGQVTATITAQHGVDTYVAIAAGEVAEFVGYYHDDTFPFEWIEISGTGTPLHLQDEDQYVTALPFPISFYGAQYNAVTIGSNGDIYFETAQSDYDNLCIPSATWFGAERLVALFWDDLNPQARGDVYVEVQGAAPERRLVIEYSDIPHYVEVGEPASEPASFEIVFFEGSDEILMQYLDVDFASAAYDFGATATVGLQRDADYGQAYSCMEATLSNNKAILWYRGQAPASPLSRINLQSPADGTLHSSPPAFAWAVDGGASNAFIVDMALSLSGPIYSTPVLYSTGWTVPAAKWNMVPSGGHVYWRVRGADLDETPLAIITSDEVWGLDKN